ncbi:MAG: putative permease, partial [Armatimonadetes bacterium]|nr:putative permease [Armatimonadota bacterium]
QLGRYTMNAVVGIVMVVLMLVLVLFTVSNPVPLVVGLLSAVPDRHRERTANALRRVMEQLKNWAVGSLVLGVIIGIMTGAGLWGLGMATGHPFPYVLLFSVIAGIGEMIPNIGPVVSAVPPALVALTIDPMLGIWVLVLFLVIQQLENNLIVPVVMGQSLDLHPLSVTFTVLVMGALFGLIGAIIAVPVCAIVKVCWQEFYLAPRHPNVEAIAAQAEALLNLPGTTGVASEKLEKQTQDAVAEAESTTRP